MWQTPSPLTNGFPVRSVVAFPARSVVAFPARSVVACHTQSVVAFPYRCVVSFPARFVVAFLARSEARVVGALARISDYGPQVQNFPLVSTSIAILKALDATREDRNMNFNASMSFTRADMSKHLMFIGGRFDKSFAI